MQKETPLPPPPNHTPSERTTDIWSQKSFHTPTMPMAPPVWKEPLSLFPPAGKKTATLVACPHWPAPIASDLTVPITSSVREEFVSSFPALFILFSLSHRRDRSTPSLRHALSIRHWACQKNFWSFLMHLFLRNLRRCRVVLRELAVVSREPAIEQRRYRRVCVFVAADPGASWSEMDWKRKFSEQSCRSVCPEVCEAT